MHLLKCITYVIPFGLQPFPEKWNLRILHWRQFGNLLSITQHVKKAMSGKHLILVKNSDRLGTNPKIKREA